MADIVSQTDPCYIEQAACFPCNIVPIVYGLASSCVKKYSNVWIHHHLFSPFSVFVCVCGGGGGGEGGAGARGREMLR